MNLGTGYSPLLSQLLERTSLYQNIYKPVFFRLTDTTQKQAFEQLLLDNPNIQVYNHILSQVEELIKCVTPTIVFLPPTEMQKAVAQHFGDKDETNYGVWVYYPWAQKLVHILDEEEFAIVRTNRNKHKITAEEQATLATKKIGVMGLSVGQSVSLTLAMERGFGELRIADFDTLDLSNINRIRTGIFNLKTKKTVVVAREIAEIDPYLNVICFEEGITTENLDSFLTGNGKLDLLIDECDSFDIKISSRNKAKALGIPVLMEGSDRGTIDIERFDLEPERPVLHGMVAHLDMSKYKELKTLDERVPYITAVTGVETLSPRMKASAVEIMASISTWPQLASAVTFGGGITADLSRKILLNNLNVSGRFFIDMDELITDPKKEKNTTTDVTIAPLTTEEIEKFLATNTLAFDRADYQLPTAILDALVSAAGKAPSGGNNQPWRLHYKNNILHLFLEKSAAQAYLDPLYISSYTSIGAAIENIVLAAASHHIKAKINLTPQFAPNHIAWFSFEPAYQASETEITLAKQIDFRHTNRKITPPAILNPTEQAYLTDLVTEFKGAKVTWLQDKGQIKSLANIAVTADLQRMFIEEAHEDFINREMRWSVEDAIKSEDGIGVHTLDLSNNDQVGIRFLKDNDAVKFLHKIKGGSAFKRLTSQQFIASSAIGLITMPKGKITSFIEGGIAAEKLWLGATAIDWQIHPVNVPLIFFYKNSVENHPTIPVESKTLLTNLETTFKQIFEMSEEDEAIFMFRIFKASPSPERTVRKATAKIFSIGRD
ncbi:MAG: Rv1355c family protein [Flavobacterium sp.]|nr:MAG: Rv1355c family protein [Flavobacterium sp.]